MKVQTKPLMHSDHKYLMALVENDSELIEEIYQKCSEPISRMIQKNGGTVTEAKDIFQESLISLYKQAREGFILQCPLENFLFLICKRKWLNALRKTKYDCNTKNLNPLSIEDDSTHIHNRFLLLEAQESLIDRKLKMLTPSCREIIFKSWSKNQDGKYFNWKEIAEELDLSYGYVRKKASQCKTRLIELVKKDPDYIRLKR